MTTISQRGFHLADLPDPHRWGRAVFALIRQWHERMVYRRELSALEPRLLKDIGLEPYEARREADKPFWQA